ncbi:hypothetical protein HK101_000526 [Irineochytrium annulatum]|nr:hypothetical protein HK101_000526 [Irineochytrium annulatum]
MTPHRPQHHRADGHQRRPSASPSCSQRRTGAGAGAGGVRLPLHTRSTLGLGPRTALSLSSHKDLIRSRFASVSTRVNTSDHHQRDGLPLTHLGLGNYFLNVSIGTPSTTYLLSLDTGSTTLWVSSTPCTTCNDAHYYDPALSSSYVPDAAGDPSARQDLGYGVGSARGVWGAETVGIGGLRVAKQPFVMVDQEDDAIRGQMRGIFDGFVGFGMGQGTLVSNLVEEGMLEREVFAVWLNGDDEAVGEVTLGFVDPERYVGGMAYYNVPTGSGYWGVSVRSLMLSTGVPLAATPRTAYVDTGTALLVLDKLTLASYIATLPFAVTSAAGGLYALPTSCPSPPGLTFGLEGGGRLEIDGGGLLVRDDDGRCYLGVQEVESLGEQWILGEVVLRGLLTVFDAGGDSRGPRVGFAKATMGDEVGTGGEDVGLTDASNVGLTHAKTGSDVRSATLVVGIVASLIGAVAAVVLFVSRWRRVTSKRKEEHARRLSSRALVDLRAGARLSTASTIVGDGDADASEATETPDG